MGALDMLKDGVMALVFVAILAGAGAIALDSFDAQLDEDTATDNITESGSDGILGATDFFGTIGTLLGVGALIAVVMGALYFGSR